MDPHRPLPDRRGLTSGSSGAAVPAMAAERIEALVVAAQGGDREAFTSLVVEFYPQLAGFLAFHAPTPEMMDELVQSTLVTAFERIGEYQPTGSFAGWLKGIARNLLRRELARLTRLTHSDLAAIEGLLADAALQDLEGEAQDGAAQDDLLARLRRC